MPGLQVVAPGTGSLEETREDYDWLESDVTIVVWGDTTLVQWWTFGGLLYNMAAATALSDLATKVQANNLSIDFHGSTPVEKIAKAIEQRTFASSVPPSVPIDRDYLDELKFHECLAAATATSILENRFSVQHEHDEIRKKGLKVQKNCQ